MKRLALLVPRSRAANVTAALALTTLLVAIMPGATQPPLRSVLDLLLFALLSSMAVSAWLGGYHSLGTRRAVVTGMAFAAGCAALGHGLASVMAVVTGNRAPFPAPGDMLLLAGHLSLTIGFARALRRVHPMRFGAMVDALLLIAAAVILVFLLDYFPDHATQLSPVARYVVVLWQMVGAITLLLLAMLLAWRGERLGASTSVGLTIGTVAMTIGSAWYMRIEMDSGAANIGPAVALLAVALLGFVHVLGRREVGIPGLTAERPCVESDAATIRAVAIVFAILIASGSAVWLGFGDQPSRGLSLTVGGFGVLLAVRTAYALWEQRQITVALENSVVAEREMSATLEQRVNDRTRELAEAQRALQRMWALAQQIALELDRARVMERFLEAIADVARADGAIVAIQGDERLQVEAASGIAEPLRGMTLSPDSALGCVLHAGEPWWTENVHHRGAGSAVVAEAESAPEILGMAAVPLQRRGERVGAVGVVSRRQRRFNDRDIAHVEAMTDLLSLALANVSLVESMRQTEWRFRTLFRAAPDAVLTVLESGRIREANEAVREITGLEPPNVVGRSIDDLVAPEDRERVRFELAETLAGAPARLEARFLHTSGTRVVSLAARRLPQADPPTVLLVGRDMTSEREMRARLAETERLAAVGELVAGVAHEVNNPLCTISAFAQLMMKDVTMTAEQRESVDVIQSETVRASQVLRDLLTFARRSDGVRQPVDLNEVLQRTARLRAFELEQEQITLEMDLAESLPAVDGDPGQLQQVVLNLLVNAVQAMKSRKKTKVLRMTTHLDGDLVVMDVGDTGPGISAEVRARIFEPFFTTKKEGTGLGLSVSYGIVAAHGGSIGIARSSSAGTTFRVTLRRASETAADDDDLGHVILAERSPLRGNRVLFVDDEPALRTGMMTFGRLRKINVVTAEDGSTALAAAHIGDFDAVICDLRMPGMDGATFWEALRVEKPTLAARTVFITGDVVSPGSRSFLDNTAQPVITKPFEFSELERVVAGLMRTEEAAAD